MSEKQNRKHEQGMEKYFFRASASDFKRIPSSPIAYWVKATHLFEGKTIGDIFVSGGRNKTHDNEKYLRFFWEVRCQDDRWVSYANGGDFRKYAGNELQLVDWSDDARSFYDSHGGLCNPKFWDKEGITWSLITSATNSFRIKPTYSQYSSGSPTIFTKNYRCDKKALAFLNSPISYYYLKAINPTLNTTVNDVFALPFPEEVIPPVVIENADRCIDISSVDWDSFETSWDFTILPLLNSDCRQPTLKATYQKLRSHWLEMTLEMQRLEEENNRIFIEAYGLQDELTPEVPLGEITLTCNPHYRYGGDRSEEELEALLLADTMRELVSYAVGCMFGRYSLDKPGLILANQGETLADFVRKVCSEKWVVKIRDYPLSTGANGENDYGDSEKLPGVDSLAEGNGLGGTGLSGDQTVPEGGALRVNQSSQAVSGFHSVQHSGRSGQKIDGGVSEFFINCERFKSRDGDPNPACPALEVCNERYSAANSQPVRRSEPTFERSDEQSQITTHCPLSTIHFLPDDDNVIPMLDGDWFADDITERFKRFLRIAFGKERYEENLAFIEQALNIKGKRNYGIRDYFLSEFYNDHVKRYKKRPIYWLFSSPRGSFNALIYMHRYRPDTVSVVLNDYLREFRTKLTSHKNHLEAVSISGSSSQGEKTKALKESEKISKMIAEIEEYEREVLYPLATEQVEIDLDDGVRANYPKFGTALKKIQGLDAKED